MKSKIKVKSLTLFTDNFPDNATNNEIKELFEQKPEYDHYYIATASIKDRKEKVDQIWQKYKTYASDHFFDEYKLKGNFHARMWEMYLGVTLINNGLKIKTTKKDDWPDFIVNNSIYIECIACQNAETDNKPDFVPPVKYDGTAQNVPVDQILMRITSAITNKHCDYKKHFKKGDIDSKTPFIVAVNSGAFRHNQSGVFPIIYKVLFGIHHPVLHLRREGTSVKGVGFDISTREQMYKYEEKKKAPIDLNIFLNDKYKEISGIIFCSNNIINAPEKLGDDCLFIPNPHAKNSIDPKIFSFFKQPEDVKSAIDVRRFI
jgi:hypothetical protein